MSRKADSGSHEKFSEKEWNRKKGYEMSSHLDSK
jgi:hypothetical protein